MRNRNLNSNNRFSDLDSESKKKDSLFLMFLITCLLMFACSLGYNNILKPYLAKLKVQTENNIANKPLETERTQDIYSSVDDNDLITEGKTTIATELETRTSPTDKKRPVVAEKESISYQPSSSSNTSMTIQKAESQPAHISSPTDVSPAIAATTNLDDSPVSTPQYSQKEKRMTKVDDSKGLSTMEILERQSHADAVRRAKDMGVSTEGSTLDILERMSHADAVKRAKKAGVSTEGSTLDILERMSHADAVKRAKKAGVSTEGSTLDILERMSHADAVKRAKKAGVSTEGSTLDILERMSHADAVKRAKKAGVSTEGSTLDILERIYNTKE